MNIPPREPHFHKRGYIIDFMSCPKSVCPLCASEEREAMKRLKMLLRPTSQ